MVLVKVVKGRIGLFVTNVVLLRLNESCSKDRVWGRDMASLVVQAETC